MLIKYEWEVSKNRMTLLTAMKYREIVFNLKNDSFVKFCNQEKGKFSSEYFTFLTKFFQQCGTTFYLSSFLLVFDNVQTHILNAQHFLS